MHKKKCATLLFIFICSLMILPPIYGQEPVQIGENENWQWGFEFDDFIGYRVTSEITIEGTDVTFKIVNYIGFNVASNETAPDTLGSLQLAKYVYEAETEQMHETDFILQYSLNQTEEEEYYLIENDPFTEQMLNAGGGLMGKVFSNIILDIPFFLVLPVNQALNPQDEGYLNASYWYLENRTEIVNFSSPIDLEEPSLTRNFPEAYGMTQEDVHVYNDNLLNYWRLIDNDGNYTNIDMSYNSKGILDFGDFTHLYNFTLGEQDVWAKISQTFELTEEIDDLIGVQYDQFNEQDRYYLQTMGEQETMLHYKNVEANIRNNASYGPFETMWNGLHEISMTPFYFDSDAFMWRYLYPWEHEGSVYYHLNDYDAFPVFENLLTSQILMDVDDDNELQVDYQMSEDSVSDLIGLILTINDDTSSIIDASVEFDDVLITIENNITAEAGDPIKITPKPYLDEAFNLLPSFIHQIDIGEEYIRDISLNAYEFFGSMAGFDVSFNYTSSNATYFEYNLYEAGTHDRLGEINFTINLEDGSLNTFQFYHDLMQFEGSMVQMTHQEMVQYKMDLYGVEYNIEIGDILYYEITNSSNPYFNETYVAYEITGFDLEEIDLVGGQIGTKLAFTVNAISYNWTYIEEAGFNIWQETESHFKWTYNHGSEMWEPYFPGEYDLILSASNGTHPYIPETHINIVNPTFIETGHDLITDELIDLFEFVGFDEIIPEDNGIRCVNLGNPQYSVNVTFDGDGIITYYNLSMPHPSGYDYSFEMVRISEDDLPLIPVELDLEEIEIRKSGGLLGILWNFSSQAGIREMTIKGNYVNWSYSYPGNDPIYVGDGEEQFTYFLQMVYATDNRTDEIVIEVENYHLQKNQITIPTNVNSISQNFATGIASQKLVNDYPVPGIFNSSDTFFGREISPDGNNLVYQVTNKSNDDSGLYRYHVNSQSGLEHEFFPDVLVSLINASIEKYDFDLNQWNTSVDYESQESYRILGVENQFFSVAFEYFDQMFPLVFAQNLKLTSFWGQMDIFLWLQGLEPSANVTERSLDVFIDIGMNQNISISIDLLEDVSLVKSFEIHEQTQYHTRHMLYEFVDVKVLESNVTFQEDGRNTTMTFEIDLDILNFDNADFLVGITHFIDFPLLHEATEIYPIGSDNNINFSVVFDFDDKDAFGDHDHYWEYIGHGDQHTYSIKVTFLIHDGAGQYTLYTEKVNVPIGDYIVEPTPIARYIAYVLIGIGVAGGIYVGIRMLLNRGGDMIDGVPRADFCRDYPDHEKC